MTLAYREWLQYSAVVWYNASYFHVKKLKIFVTLLSFLLLILQVFALNPWVQENLACQQR